MGVKMYFKKQCQLSVLKLEHHSPSDFHLSCFQKNRAVLPFLCVKAVIFLGCLAILLASLILTARSVGLGLWFIYLTHWGLLLITVTSGVAFAVSCRAYTKGPDEASLELPWYLKTYWALYTTAVTMAFFITIYYYTFLAPTGSDASSESNFAVDAVLDIFIHTMNSVLMLCLLLTSRVPCRLLHFVFPVGFGILYLIFSAIYYAAGGTDMFGNPWIYPTLDWASPWATLLMVLLSALFLVVLHLVVLALTAGRNALTTRYKRESRSMNVANTV